MQNEELNTINKNDNLIGHLMSYLRCSDLSIMSQVSKKFNKISERHFDDYWREECNRYFCSDYDHNK